MDNRNKTQQKNTKYKVVAVSLYKNTNKKDKGSPYSITERRVPELIPVLGSQPISHES